MIFVIFCPANFNIRVRIIPNLTVTFSFSLAIIVLPEMKIRLSYWVWPIFYQYIINF